MKKIDMSKIAVLCGLVLFVAGSVFVTGCGDRVSGVMKENQAPTVWFVNVPPEDSRTSTNPIINWVGQDSDGQISQYRFIVFTEADIIAMDSADAANGPDTLNLRVPFLNSPIDSSEISWFVDSIPMTSIIPDSLWTELDVNFQEGQPQTSPTVPMKAEIQSPVTTFVRQFVFVQAFDELGKASDIVFRAFLRNDNPPDTRTRGFLGGPYINATFAGSDITGIPMRWEGSDQIDYPTDPPPFEFEWRLYGPYFTMKYEKVIDTIVDTTWENLINNFVKTVFITNDARMFRVGEGLTFDDCDTSYSVIEDSTWLVCDTIIVDIGGGSFDTTISCDSTNIVVTIDCETIIVDDIEAAGPMGYLDTILDIDDPAFANDTLYNRIAKHSFDSTDADYWVFDLETRIYDVFDQAPSDSTQEQYFIFWVRSRDDAKVPDLTPTFETFSVIDPRYERDFGVVDVSIGYKVNSSLGDSAQDFWRRAVEYWEAKTGIVVNFDAADDYSVASNAQGFSFDLRRMLSHKMLVIVNDNPFPGALGNPEFVENLGKAISSGVNTWMCGRAQVVGGEAQDSVSSWLTVSQPTREDFARYFGVLNIVYSGWEHNIYYDNRRIEDFTGALSLNKSEWPDLEIDTVLLHQRYMWRDHYPWRDTIAALPEVDWYVRAQWSEAMYLYNSKYGSKHFLNHPFFNFYGKPVMSRVNRGFFRTVHSMFTPYSIKESASMPLIKDMLSWLYDPYLSAPPAAPRYSGSDVYPISMSELSKSFWDSMKRKAEKDPYLSKGLE